MGKKSEKLVVNEFPPVYQRRKPELINQVHRAYQPCLTPAEDHSVWVRLGQGE